MQVVYPGTGHLDNYPSSDKSGNEPYHGVSSPLHVQSIVCVLILISYMCISVM